MTPAAPDLVVVGGARLDAAAATLAEAGYPEGFRITLSGPNDRYINDEQVAQAVAQMMAQIGIRVSVDASTASRCGCIQSSPSTKQIGRASCRERV